MSEVVANIRNSRDAFAAGSAKRAKCTMPDCACAQEPAAAREKPGDGFQLAMAKQPMQSKMHE
jgi:hypothetical protein